MKQAAKELIDKRFLLNDATSCALVIEEANHNFWEIGTTRTIPFTFQSYDFIKL